MNGFGCCDGVHSMVFVYGTLKKGQPNYHHFDNPENGKAKFIAKGYTEVAYPLIIATRWNLPFLLFAPGKGTVSKFR